MTRTGPEQEAARDPGRAPFRALRVRNYRIYASANLVSLTGTWMQRIGQDWLVLQLSDDNGVALGLITALQFGPTLLLSMYGGVLADRYDKRRMLLVTQTLMGLLALVLAILVATDAAALWHVFVLAGGLGSVSAVDAPVRQAFVSELVGPALLTNAVSLNSTIFNGARLVGPAVAGLLIGAASGNTAPAFFVNAASFAFTIAALAGMRTAELQPSAPVARAKGQLRAGVAYTWAHPDLVLAMGLALVLGTFGFNYQVTIALMAREQFDLGAEAFGLLSTTFAVGSLTGALLSTRRNVRPRQSFLVISAVAFGLLTVIAGLMPGYASFAVLLVPTGAAALVFSVANNSFVQLGVDPQMRGRVMALYFMCFMGGTPVGAPLIGWISENLGARWGLIMGGAICVVTGIGAAAWLARGRRVRLEAGLRPRRLRLRVGAPGTRVASAPLRAAEEAVAEKAPGQQGLGP
jgi:MFS family permease